MNIHNPGNKKPYDKLWAILSVDKNGNEGICAINTPIGPQVAITGEQKLLDMYIDVISKESAKRELSETNLKIVIAEYSRSKTEDLK